MWHCIVGCSSSSLCGKRCRRAVWNFLSILNGSEWVSSCCLLSDSLQNSYVWRRGCQTNDRPQMGVLFLDQFGFCSSWELNRHGHSIVWSRNSILRNLLAQGQEMQYVYRALCLVEQTSAHQPLIINSFAEKLANVLQGGNWFVLYVCVRLQANLLSSHRSLVHRVETIALGDKPCDRGEHVTLFLFNDCLEVKLSLCHCTITALLNVFWKYYRWADPPPHFFIMQILHQVPQSSATIWKTLILISGLISGVRLMKAL